jgi:hypothetical protein
MLASARQAVTGQVGQGQGAGRRVEVRCWLWQRGLRGATLQQGQRAPRTILQANVIARDALSVNAESRHCKKCARCTSS